MQKDRRIAEGRMSIRSFESRPYHFDRYPDSLAMINYLYIDKKAGTVQTTPWTSASSSLLQHACFMISPHLFQLLSLLAVI